MKIEAEEFIRHLNTVIKRDEEERVPEHETLINIGARIENWIDGTYEHEDDRGETVEYKDKNGIRTAEVTLIQNRTQEHGNETFRVLFGLYTTTPDDGDYWNNLTTLRFPTLEEAETVVREWIDDGEFRCDNRVFSLVETQYSHDKSIRVDIVEFEYLGTYPQSHHILYRTENGKTTAKLFGQYRFADTYLEANREARKEIKCD